MKRAILVCALLSGLFGVQAVYGQAEPENCCQTCSCIYCTSIGECQALEPGFTPENLCTALEPGDCDKDGTPCDDWWDNGSVLVTSATPRPTDPTGCIPIDGGLGFLIAGGLGIGVLGIRRKDSQRLVERAA